MPPTATRRFSKLLTCSLALVAALSHAAAQESDLERTTFLGHLNVYEKAETYSSILGGKVHLLEPGGTDFMRDADRALLVEGVISRETARNVQTLLHRISGIRTVYVDSPGGDLYAGLDLGRTLASGRYLAVVGEKAECVSACALAFLGAASRMVLADGSKFGFHRQYYIKEGAPAYGSWKVDVAEIQSYLSAVGFSGVRADEIVGTTGLATYSDSRLAERGIVTITRKQHSDSIRTTVELTGVSVAEKYVATCLLLAAQFDCASIFFPFRLPLLLSHFREERSQLFNIKVMKAISPYFQNVKRESELSNLNCDAMGAAYVEYASSRLAQVVARGFTASELKINSEKALREMKSCGDRIASAKARDSNSSEERGTRQ